MALLLGALGLIEALLDALAALIHHREDLRPGDLRQDDQMMRKRDERGDELRHLGDEDARTTRLLGKRRDRSAERGARGGRGDAGNAMCELHDVLLMPHAGAFLGNEGHDEADEAECLGEGGRQDEDRERAALNLGLTRHGARGAERRKADGKAGTDNTETVSDNSHNSLLCHAPVWRGTPTYGRGGARRPGHLLGAPAR